MAQAQPQDPGFFGGLKNNFLINTLKGIQNGAVIDPTLTLAQSSINNMADRTIRGRMKDESEEERQRRLAAEKAAAESGVPVGAIPTPDGNTATLQDPHAMDAELGLVPATEAVENPPTEFTAPESEVDVAEQQEQAEVARFHKENEDAARIAAKGGAPAPNPVTNPVESLGQLNNNRIKGVGNSVGEVEAPTPPIPTAKQAADNELKDIGNKAAFEQTKIPVWYESGSFNMGLLSFGLNLLSGNDLATSFNQASKAFTDMYGSEKRQAWAGDLAAQGYSRAEIEAYIQTGDPKMLKDPMEKQAAIQNIQLGREQIEAAKFKNSPEERARAEEDRQFDKALKVSQLNDSRAARADAAEMRRLNLQDRQEARAEKAAAKAAEGEKYSEGKSKAENQYIRGRQGMQNYEAAVSGMKEDPYSKNFAGKMYDAATIEGIFSGNQVKETAARSVNPGLTELVTREREFLAPLLRKDSGAAISASEWKTTGEIYFPRPGDSKTVRDQKAQSRAVAVLAMNPTASPELKSALDRYTMGDVKGLKIISGKVYANDGKGWMEVQQ